MSIDNYYPAIDWAPSVYFADSLVKCSHQRAWAELLKYRSWNPTFAGAKMTPLKGRANCEGEIVLISKTLSNPKSEAFPEFYCETLKVIPEHRITWYVYAKEGHTYHKQQEPFRNFVDFALSVESDNVRFCISYYAQNRLSGELLVAERSFMPKLLRDIAAAFRDHCEATNSP